MNLVGKIFTVLIFIMSIVFAALTVSVYATHKNYRYVLLNEDTSTGKLGYKPRLEQALDENERLLDQQEELRKFNKAELEAKIDALSALENTNSQMQEKNTALKKQLAEANQKATQAVAELNISQQTLAGLRGQNVALRKDILAARTEKDSKHALVVELTDDLHQEKLMVEQLGKRNQDLLKDLSDARGHIIKLGGTPGKPDLKKPHVGIEGIVTATPTRETIEISIGSDDSLSTGHQLDVTRTAGGQASYVGRVEVISVRADAAACKVLPQWLKKPIQRGDRVTTVSK